MLDLHAARKVQIIQAAWQRSDEQQAKRHMCMDRPGNSAQAGGQTMWLLGIWPTC
jgi:hypothetical protein